jgi:hypothetical protein
MWWDAECVKGQRELRRMESKYRRLLSVSIAQLGKKIGMDEARRVHET